LAFLRTIDERKLDCKDFTAHAITLTVRECPETGKDWHAIRKAFLMRMTRLGMIRGHWVTEWQRRGVPHLHGCLWLPSGVQKAEIVRHWLDLTADKHGALPKAQYILRITDALGWFKYLGKHAARGVSHYQRNSANIPEGWKTKTGRVWGHVGEWPLANPIKYKLESEGFYRFRRLARSWRIADARARAPSLIKKLHYSMPTACLMSPLEQFRASGAAYAIKSARSVLKCSELKLSNVRGVSEWVPGETSYLFLTFLLSEGHELSQRESA
jgi:hypothetical protein